MKKMNKEHLVIKQAQPKPWRSATIQPIECLENLNFLKEQFLEAIKLNHEPLLHFTTITLDTGGCTVQFDKCDFHFTFQEACKLWYTYLNEDELKGVLPDSRIPKQKKRLLKYWEPPMKHKTGVPMEYIKELENELLSKKKQSS